MAALVLPKGESKRIAKLNLPSSKIPNNIYTHIKDLPFDRFLRLYIDKDYKALAISGKPNILHLVKASELVLNQYTDEVTDTEHFGAMYILGDIGYIQFKLASLEGIIETLSLSPDNELISTVKKLGFNYQFTQETIEKDLIHLQKQKNVLDVQLTEKQFEYVRLYTDAKTSKIRHALSEHGGNLEAVIDACGRRDNGEQPTYKMFDRILASIDPKLKPEDLTTLRFTVLFNNLKMANSDGSR